MASVKLKLPSKKQGPYQVNIRYYLILKASVLTIPLALSFALLRFFFLSAEAETLLVGAEHEIDENSFQGLHRQIFYSFFY